MLKKIFLAIIFKHAPNVVNCATIGLPATFVESNAVFIHMTSASGAGGFAVTVRLK